jgi:hypothetical protein
MLFYRREQRAVMDINCVTISKILSPIQAALYMIEVYPMHCDALVRQIGGTLGAGVQHWWQECNTLLG